MDERGGEGMTADFRLWLMTCDAQLAGWVYDCQENKKQNEAEILEQQIETILVELNKIFSMLHFTFF